MISGSVFLKGLVQLVTINFGSCWNQRALDLKLFWAMKKSAFQSFVEFLFFFFLFQKIKKNKKKGSACESATAVCLPGRKLGYLIAF
jgi:hypothetical protein